MNTQEPEKPMRPGKTEQPTIPFVAFALSYARNGWPIFPLHGKIPFKDSQGYKDATTKPEQIQTWWTTHPTANIGLATGERSGIIVLDIDPPEGHFSLKELQSSHAPLPETRRSRTGNKGLHFFFQYPNDGNTYKNAVGLNGKEGVDLRATGGYVVLPPSKLYGRLAYMWGNPETPIVPLPIWLKDMILEAQQQRENIPQGLRFAGSPGDLWLAQALDKAREGNRNAVGFWLACQLRDDKVPEPEARRIGLLYANLAPQGKEQYTSKEAIASVRSAYKRPPREPARRIHP
jgi:Bifunctional DNA primase/polymerase, N-terminal